MFVVGYLSRAKQYLLHVGRGLSEAGQTISVACWSWVTSVGPKNICCMFVVGYLRRAKQYLLHVDRGLPQSGPVQFLVTASALRAACRLSLQLGRKENGSRKMRRRIHREHKGLAAVRTGKAGKVTLQRTTFNGPFTVGRFQSLSNNLIFPYNTHTIYILPSSLPFYTAVHFDIPSALRYNLFAYLCWFILPYALHVFTFIVS